VGSFTWFIVEGVGDTFVSVPTDSAKGKSRARHTQKVLTRNP
jgi:hypothetical protein